MDRLRNRQVVDYNNPINTVIKFAKHLVRDKGFKGQEAKNYITALADMHNVDRELVLKETEGWWNDELIDQLKISPTTNEILIECYNTYYRDGSHGHTFDFERNIFFSRPGSTKEDKVERVLKHFSTVRGALQSRFIANPSHTSFEKLAAQFNTSANVLKQQFPELEINFIQRIVHESRVKKPNKNFIPGTLIDEMFGLPIDDSVCWQKEFQEKLVEVGTPEMIMKIYPAVYNKMTQYHKELILIHSDIKVHKIPKHMLIQWARTLNLFFMSGIGGKINRNKLRSITEQFGKFTKLANVPLHNMDFNEGDIIAICPCLEDGIRPCSAVFNLADSATLTVFKNIFEKYTPRAQYDDDEPADPVEIMFITLSKLLDPNSNDPRVFSKCPNCDYENENDEGVRNNSGDNILLKHATDVECALCAYEYCSDCFEQHPNHICNGFPKDPDTDSRLKCCPACRHPTLKIDGCQFIRCICSVMWCWNCRLRRHEEYDPRIHYCPTIDHYSANPIWNDNLEFRPYTISPL